MNHSSDITPSAMPTGFGAVLRRSVLRIARRPIYWVGFFVMPLFFILMLTTIMESGLPTHTPAAIIDRDGSSMSREVSQNLAGMQMVDVVTTPTSFSEARKQMQSGEIFGYFLIPENFQSDLLSGRQPTITFYTNMTYFVPASLLFKSFKTTAIYTKAGVAVKVLESAGAASMELGEGVLQPVNIVTRAIGNPWLDYAVYLCNSFVPCVIQLMILLITVFSIGQEVKYHTSLQLMRMADGSIVKALAGMLLPQTIIWWVIIIFMESWLYGWQHYPMNGSWFWLTLSELMFVVACQGLGVFFYGIIPNLRLSLSVCSLLGILAFSLAAFSFPEQSMYSSISIFSWLMPIRYNFLIYIDQALNGRHIYYSKLWFVAYIIYMLLPLTVLWRIKKEFRKPVYAP